MSSDTRTTSLRSVVEEHPFFGKTAHRMGKGVLRRTTPRTRMFKGVWPRYQSARSSVSAHGRGTPTSRRTKAHARVGQLEAAQEALNPLVMGPLERAPAKDAGDLREVNALDPDEGDEELRPKLIRALFHVHSARASAPASGCRPSLLPPFKPHRLVVLLRIKARWPFYAGSKNELLSHKLFSRKYTAGRQPRTDQL